jgi:protocatechuate 3,4-dioxygenase, alpha subunit
VSGLPEATPSQTVGPFFSFGLCVRDQHELVDPERADAIRIGGRVLNGEGQPVDDALVEIWDGTRWGRCGTDLEGGYGFVTTRPAGSGAPYITALIFARGLLKPLLTRIYFPDEPGNATDPLLTAVTDDERRGLTGAAAGAGEIRFDIHLQGDLQTTFLAL